MTKQAKRTKEKTMSKENIKVVEEKNNLPTTINFAEDAGSGLENLRQDDLVIPRLKIIQSNSAQVKKTKGEYIAGAEAGDLCNQASGRLYKGDKGTLVIPVFYKREYIEWVPVDLGGGIVANHGDDETIVEQLEQVKGHWVTRNSDGEVKTEVVVNGTYFLFIVDEETGAVTPAVLSLSGTQFKKARNWNYKMKEITIADKDGKPFNPASFYMAYRLQTIPESNDSGDWYGIRITAEKATVELNNGAEIYQKAREFKELIKSGKAKAAEFDREAPEDSEAM